MIGWGRGVKGIGGFFFFLGRVNKIRSSGGVEKEEEEGGGEKEEEVHRSILQRGERKN